MVLNIVVKCILANAWGSCRVATMNKCHVYLMSDSVSVGPMASTAKIPSLYREILKAAKRFPSKKRDAILEDIKTTFHEDKVELALQPSIPCLYAGERTAATNTLLISIGVFWLNYSAPANQPIWCHLVISQSKPPTQRSAISSVCSLHSQVMQWTCNGQLPSVAICAPQAGHSCVFAAANHW